MGRIWFRGMCPLPRSKLWLIAMGPLLSGKFMRIIRLMENTNFAAAAAPETNPFATAFTIKLMIELKICNI